MADALSFDDLIPKKGAPAPISFDDLVPKKAPGGASPSKFISWCPELNVSL